MLHIDRATFSYKDTPVLDGIDLVVLKGEHVCIIGGSGCGKSTLLKLVYGQLQLDQGTITWNGKKVLGPMHRLVPGEPFMKFLSQDLDLMPYISVAENVSHHLSVFEPDEMQRRTTSLLELIEMADYADTKVKFLSGGQKQRVALAKALAEEPDILLLDEPFAHIDHFRKNTLRRKLFPYLRDKGVTVVTATHDPRGTLPFADKVVALHERRILADDAPANLFQRPGDLYIATLFGEANRIPINIVKSYAETKKYIIVYAHEFKVSKKNGLRVVVERSFYMGENYLIAGQYENEEILFYHDKAMERDKVVYLNISLETINRRIMGH